MIKFGLKIYSYQSIGEEIYINNELNSFTSQTIQNEKKKNCNVKKDLNNKYIIKGSSYNNKNPLKFIIGNYWNHSSINYNKQIKPSSCKVIDQKIKFVGREELKLNNNLYKTLKFIFYSSDKSLSKNKDFKMTVWYNENNLILLKILYTKLGTWEYRLKLYK